MKITGTNLSAKSDDGDMFFNAIDFSFETGKLSIIATDDSQKAVTFCMLASGRLRKYRGTVSIRQDDGKVQESIVGLYGIRKVTAVPYVPKIGEPDEYLKLWCVLKEEFLFANKNLPKNKILDYIQVKTGEQFPDPEAVRMKDISNVERVKMFTEIAIMRPNVRFVFVTLPEKYGGFPASWFKEIKKLQTKDIAIILLTSKVTAAALGEEYYDLDSQMRFYPSVPENLSIYNLVQNSELLKKNDVEVDEAVKNLKLAISKRYELGGG
ncbi:MAG: hypothetical protein LBL41_00565 [Bifidobacteriaceae bacterium]|jgi:hypothetical protein|nr:hypothetical protein [Bifidobacteriaceae bacterium]